MKILGPPGGAPQPRRTDVGSQHVQPPREPTRVTPVEQAPTDGLDAQTVAAAREHLGGGLAPARLSAEIARAARTVEALLTSALPEEIHGLVDAYARVGLASATAQAVLISALDALDPKTGGGVARPPEAFKQLRDEAMRALRRAGEVFAHLEPAFGPLVHGGGGWPNQPVVAKADRGDGRPLVHYRNTFKKGRVLDDGERHAEYQQRVDKFVAAGGRFEDIAVLEPGHLETLVHRERYDYVMTAAGTTRVGTTRGDAKPGHSLLAEGGPTLGDEPVLLAGEMWALRDSAGDLEVLLVANNSGHFKPSFEDLDNALAVLERAGVPREKVVLFGGPNNLPAMFAEIGENKAFPGLEARLPPSPRALLEAWAAPGCSALDVRS